MFNNQRIVKGMKFEDYVRKYHQEHKEQIRQNSRFYYYRHYKLKYVYIAKRYDKTKVFYKAHQLAQFIGITKPYLSKMMKEGNPVKGWRVYKQLTTDYVAAGGKLERRR